MEKRPISIIDPETTEEVKPVLYYDEKTKEVKGKCKLKPNKPYFVFEIREENNKLNLVGGSPTITDQGGRKVMSNLNWPPENTFKYEFNEQLDLEIPLKENKLLKKAKANKSIEDKSIGE